MKVHEAILDVMRAVPVVKKEDRNQAQNFSFRGIDATLNAVGPKLRDVGVLVYPKLTEHHAEAVTVGARGTAMRSVTVLVQYTFVGPEGDTLTAEVPGEAMDSGDKAYSKAMSVAFRTALLQTLALPTDERDPDADSHERTSALQPSSQRSTRAKPKTEADIARDDLLTRVEALELNIGDVKQLYLAENGVPIKDETDGAKIASFTERLQPK